MFARAPAQGPAARSHCHTFYTQLTEPYPPANVHFDSFRAQGFSDMRKRIGDPLLSISIYRHV